MHSHFLSLDYSPVTHSLVGAGDTYDDLFRLDGMTFTNRPLIALYSNNGVSMEFILSWSKYLDLNLHHFGMVAFSTDGTKIIGYT